MRLSTAKTLCTVFWYNKGILLVDFLHKLQTINSVYNCELLDKTETEFLINLINSLKEALGGQGSNLEKEVGLFVGN